MGQLVTLHTITDHRTQELIFEAVYRMWKVGGNALWDRRWRALWNVYVAIHSILIRRSTNLISGLAELHCLYGAEPSRIPSRLNLHSDLDHEQVPLTFFFLLLKLFLKLTSDNSYYAMCCIPRPR